jgi:hypothetical protein
VESVVKSNQLVGKGVNMSDFWTFNLTDVLTLLCSGFTIWIYSRQANIMNKQVDIAETQTKLLKPDPPTIILTPAKIWEDENQVGLLLSLYNNSKSVLIFDQIEIVSGNLDFIGSGGLPTKVLHFNQRLRASGFTNKGCSNMSGSLHEQDADFIPNLVLGLITSKESKPKFDLKLKISIIECNNETVTYTCACEFDTEQRYIDPPQKTFWRWDRFQTKWFSNK